MVSCKNDGVGEKHGDKRKIKTLVPYGTDKPMLGMLLNLPMVGYV